MYKVSATPHQHVQGALVDGGANGGLIGADARILEYVPDAYIDVTGINDTEVPGIPIGQAAGFVDTVDSGPIIVIMSQYAVLGTGKTIHSKGQMEHFGISIDDKSRIAGGNQCLITQEGHVIPLHIRDGLPRMDMRPPTDKELEEYPHVYLTSDTQWDPTVLDCEFDDTFYDAVSTLPDVVSHREVRDPRVDDTGFLRTRDDYEALFRAQDAFIAEQALIRTA